MKTIYKLLSCVLLVASQASFASTFQLPDYEKVTLSNGLTVYLMEQKEVPLIDVSVVVKAGAVADEKAGTATLTSGTLLLGTESMAREKIEETFDFLGSTIASNATHEYSRVDVSMASKDWETILPLIYDIVTRPAFDQKEFDSYKARHVAGLARNQESPRQMIGSFFNAQLFAGHPYANNLDGNVTSVNAITADDVKAFHKNWYTPDNSAVVVVGNIPVAEAKEAITKLFGQWSGKATKADPLATPTTPTKGSVLLVNKQDANESTFMIGGPGVSFDNPDYVAISIINTVLGGRFTSWLNDELRVNSGLTYGARSSFVRRLKGGSFFIYSFTKTATTTEAIDLALETYQRLWKKGIDDETLASAKAYVKGQFPPDFETSSQLADLLGDMFIYGFNEDFINTFSKQVDELNRDRVKTLVETYFPQQNLQFVIVGKADDIKQKVAKYGAVTETEITTEL